ncbi:hypothetical protein WJX73_008753 [Symbiochloris irregularis]|uniref:PUA domain-containing protein n=1 Tax=Symbiochloris irregularis TaxID=706552 RepID=A0AAW1NN75_9CHLO
MRRWRLARSHSALWSQNCFRLHVSAAQTEPARRVVLREGKARLFKDGQPLVYGGAVSHTIGSPRTGDTVLVTDHRDNTVGWGFFNSESMFRVRVMQLHAEFQADAACVLAPEELIRTRISAAVALRKALTLPNPSTNAYRLVNSEGDRMSGLIVDVISRHAVVASSAAWVERWKPEIIKAIEHATQADSVSWLQTVGMLQLEGVILDGLADKRNLDRGARQDVIKAKENGAVFMIPVAGGQKTGLYADQRDSRLYLRSLCESSTVLDLCCYTGWFTINAALGNAQHVTGVDTSQGALDLAARNREVNGVEPEQCEFVCEDITHFMRDALTDGKTWDIVILDPPKLAPNRKALPRATGKYQRWNASAMRLVRPGGLLMTCSCSGAMTQSKEFLTMIKAAAIAANRRVTVLRQVGAGPDHPLDPCYPEGEYLTNVLLCVH